VWHTIEAYNSLASCNTSYRLLEQVTILQDAVEESYGDTFSYILRAQGKCTGCNEGDVMLPLTLEGDRRRLEERQGRYSTKQKGSLRKVEAEDCICEAPLKDTFLSQYQEAYQETTSSNTTTSLAKFEIVDVTELDLQVDCDPSTKFASTVLLRFRVPQEEDALTQDQREELKELFLESCNAVNILNADLCDPHAQELDFIKEITYIDPSSFPLLYPIDTSNEVVSLFEDRATIYLMMYVAGHCHDCDDKTNLFDKESSPSRRNAKLRRLEEENHVCLCPFDVPS
jgi:hypothetical protein